MQFVILIASHRALCVKWHNQLKRPGRYILTGGLRTHYGPLAVTNKYGSFFKVPNMVTFQRPVYVESTTEMKSVWPCDCANVWINFQYCVGVLTSIQLRHSHGYYGYGSVHSYLICTQWLYLSTWQSMNNAKKVELKRFYRHTGWSARKNMLQQTSVLSYMLIWGGYGCP